MTRQQACRILGIRPDASGSEIKKRYRNLMMQVHPDVHHTVRKSYPYSAKDINRAYSFLKGTMGEAQTLSKGDSRQKTAQTSGTHASGSSFSGRYSSKSAKRSAVWDAPVNPQAYTEREIYHYAEDFDGTIIGHFTIARGKFLWQLEEDFPLFLRSIYQCGKKLLDDIDDALGRRAPSASRMDIQTELTYLLAQQFIHSTALLRELTKKQWTAEDGAVIFLISSMLESPAPSPLSAKEVLYPAGIRQHRLYLKDRAGKELGYLSFHDDRMYYVVVPLLEQRGVMVRIEAAGTARKLHLWLKVPPVTAGHMPENLNLKIEHLLNEYRRWK